MSLPVLTLSDGAGSLCLSLQDITKLSLIEQKAIKNQFKKIESLLAPDSIIHNNFFYQEDKAIRFICDILPKLKLNWQIKGFNSLKRYNMLRGKYKLDFIHKKSYIKIKGSFFFGEESVTIKEIAQNVKNNYTRDKKYIQLKKNKGVLPENWQKNLLLLELSQLSEKEIIIPQIHYPILKHFSKVVLNKKKVNLPLPEVKEIPKVSSYLEGNLRPYQKKGYEWLWKNYLSQRNVLLADDMGLGKTVQILAFLISLYEKKQNLASTLIILPKSLMFNWANEIRQFTPRLKWKHFYGTKRNFLQLKMQTRAGPFQQQVILTTYGVIKQDYRKLKEINWEVIVLDESQMIKNPSSEAYKSISALDSQFKISSSGTPVENHFTDLWANLNFLYPQHFSTVKKFIHFFDPQVEKKHFSLLNEILKEILLRREKEMVAKELLGKKEIIIPVELSQAEYQLYKRVQNRFYKKIFKEIRIESRKHHVFTGILRLRQVCCHPQLLSENIESSKLKIVIFYLKKAILEGHNVLLFSQFVTLLDLVEIELKKSKISFLRLDGNSKNRKAIVEEYQRNADISLMLLTLKAGGVGLNLNKADYVFHYDPWWNPFAEKQANDRSYRIGQKKEVFVYKFITKNSIEEKICHLQREKHEFFELILGNNQVHLDQTLIKELFLS